MPDYYKPGQPSKPDFVGWSGIGPIALLIENVLGFRVNAVNQTLTWYITRTDKHGIKNLRVANNTVSAICNPSGNKKKSLELKITTNENLKLIIIRNNREEEFELNAGEHMLTIR